MNGLRLIILFFAALVLLPGSFETARADELSAMFGRILRNPDNVALNLRYAHLAEAAGKPRLALGAYERVIAADPSNREAATGLARLRVLFEPTVTRVTASVGADYETNPRNLPGGVGSRDDVTLNAAFGIRDRRALFGGVWSSIVNGYGELHTDIGDLDFGRLQAYSGPVMDLGGSAKLHIAPGASVATLDDRFYYVEPGIHAGISRIWPGVIDAITLKVAYRDVAKHFKTRDGVLVDLSLRNTQRNVLTAGDSLHIVPRLRYREPTGDNVAGAGAAGGVLPGNYLGLGGSIYHYLPLGHGITWGTVLTAIYRDYDHDVRFGSKERHDWFISPGAELRFGNIICQGCDLKLHYRFEKNHSNDSTERFESHNAGLRATRRF